MLESANGDGVDILRRQIHSAHRRERGVEIGLDLGDDFAHKLDNRCPHGWVSDPRPLRPAGPFLFADRCLFEMLHEVRDSLLCEVRRVGPGRHKRIHYGAKVGRSVEKRTDFGL